MHLKSVKLDMLILVVLSVCKAQRCLNEKFTFTLISAETLSGIQYKLPTTYKERTMI